MARLLDHLRWRGDVPMALDGFNELDAAVLAKLAYVPLERTGGLEKCRGIPVCELAAYVTAAPDMARYMLSAEDMELCRLLSESPRYKELRLHGYVSRFDAQDETQFSAICLTLGDGRGCLAFRGTDNSIIGWKEDLNMGLSFPVPAQVSAAEYFGEADRLLSSRSYILCGHSKGGNVAVYAAAFCDRELQSRVAAVYNFDGPGFLPEALETEGYRRILGRVHTYVPCFSVFGMIFNNDRPYHIVRSDAFGILQHDMYTWEIRRGRFAYAEALAPASRQLDIALDKWIMNMSQPEREAFVDAVYHIFTYTNASTLDELSSNKLENAMVTLRAIRGLDAETRRNALRAIQLLMSSLKG